MTCGITVAPRMPTDSSSASEPGLHRVVDDRAVVGVREQELDDVADADHADDRRDHRLEQAHAAAVQLQDGDRGDAGEDGRREEVDAEQEVQAERRAEELGQVGRHRDCFCDQPQREGNRPRIAVAADLGEVAARGDAQLRRQGLDEHREQVRGDDHPHQAVAELRAGGDVGREVARVDVRNAGDERRPEEGENPKARPVNGFVDGAKALRQRCPGGNHTSILAMPKTVGAGTPV